MHQTSPPESVTSKNYYTKNNFSIKIAKMKIKFFNIVFLDLKTSFFLDLY